jgi:hypothetical protein
LSWEETGRRRYPCPCGKGEYEEVDYMDDWNRTDEKHEMVCPDCKERYVYDNTIIGGHPHDHRVRGWRLK